MLEAYFSRVRYKKSQFKDSIQVSSSEIIEDIMKVFKARKFQIPIQFFSFLRDVTGAGLWISYSYYQYLKAFYFPDIFKLNLKNDLIHKKIINAVQNKTELDSEIQFQSIFSSLYYELSLARFTSQASIFNIEPPKVSLVLVDGVFNEFFKIQSFQRGVDELSRSLKLRSTNVNVSGVRSSLQNSHAIYHDLFNHVDKYNPDTKFWLIGFSKGGVDSLHFLQSYPKFAAKHIAGLSTIACPILGSHHMNHRALKFLNHFDKIGLYQKISKSFDLFASEYRETLSYSYQSQWFEKHHLALPSNIFYTASAFESKFHQSHFWMMLTKILFFSKSANDGIVEVEQAQFPSYFDAYNLGIIPGHHLVGLRSSSFDQEAYLKAHMIFLDYFNEF